MDKRNIKIDNFLSNDVQLIMNEPDIDDAFASISLNPSLTWVKFVLTDDKPNGNKQRVPKDEFANLIKTGIHMPIKMAFGEIQDGHAESFALGTITHLKEVGSQVKGIAALWTRERPDDIQIIKEMYANNTPPQLSWEIMHDESDYGYEDDNEIENLKNVALRAATFVGMPAYQGRTPITAVANQDGDKEKKMDELETKLQKANKEIEELKVQLDEANTKLTEASDNLAELDELRTFKEEVEAERAKATKLAEIKQKFADAELEKDDDYFDSNEELLLGLSSEALEFMIQELVAFASREDDDPDDVQASLDIPPITASPVGKKGTKDLAKALRAELK